MLKAAGARKGHDVEIGDETLEWQYGIFGGAFDPPHVGHVALARTAMERFGLETPARHGRRRTPAHKRDRRARRVPARAGARSRSPGSTRPSSPSCTSTPSTRSRPHGYEDPVFLIGADELARLPDLEGAGARARAGAARGRDAARLPSARARASPTGSRSSSSSRTGLVLRDPRARRGAASRSTGLVPAAVAGGSPSSVSTADA